MLASEIKAVSVHYRPLPLDLRVDFFLSLIPPFEKCIAPGAFIQINTVGFRFDVFNTYYCGTTLALHKNTEIANSLELLANQEAIKLEVQMQLL